jgi:hypothetical protein
MGVAFVVSHYFLPVSVETQGHNARAATPMRSRLEKRSLGRALPPAHRNKRSHLFGERRWR